MVFHLFKAQSYIQLNKRMCMKPKLIVKIMFRNHKNQLGSYYFRNPQVLFMQEFLFYFDILVFSEFSLERINYLS